MDRASRHTGPEEGKGVDRGEGLRAHLYDFVKHLLRKIGARTKESLVEAMDRALGG